MLFESIYLTSSTRFLKRIIVSTLKNDTVVETQLAISDWWLKQKFTEMPIIDLFWFRFMIVFSTCDAFDCLLFPNFRNTVNPKNTIIL